MTKATYMMIVKIARIGALILLAIAAAGTLAFGQNAFDFGTPAESRGALSRTDIW